MYLFIFCSLTCYSFTTNIDWLALILFLKIVVKLVALIHLVNCSLTCLCTWYTSRLSTEVPLLSARMYFCMSLLVLCCFPLWSAPLHLSVPMICVWGKWCVFVVSKGAASKSKGYWSTLTIHSTKQLSSWQRKTNEASDSPCWLTYSHPQQREREREREREHTSWTDA